MSADNPAEPLLQAAEALNTRANGARSSAAGRWYVATKQGGYPQTVDESGTATLKANTFDEPSHEQTTAPFIASMDPQVAYKTANLLEAIAVEMDTYGATLTGDGVGIGGETQPIWTAAHELAVTYLRRPSETQVTK